MSVSLDTRTGDDYYSSYDRARLGPPKEDELTADTEYELSHETLTGMLAPFCRDRAMRDSYGKQVEMIGKLLKGYLEKHEGETIYDGEREIEAKLQNRRSGRDYDLLSLWEKDRVLFERMLLQGCLKVDDAAVKKAGQQVGGAEKYAFPNRMTTALVVTDKKADRERVQQEGADNYLADQEEARVRGAN